MFHLLPDEGFTKQMSFEKKNNSSILVYKGTHIFETIADRLILIPSLKTAIAQCTNRRRTKKRVLVLCWTIRLTRWLSHEKYIDLENSFRETFFFFFSDKYHKKITKTTPGIIGRKERRNTLRKQVWIKTKGEYHLSTNI